MVADLIQSFIAQCGGLFGSHAAQNSAGDFSVPRWNARELPRFGRKCHALRQGCAVDASVELKFFNFSVAASACISAGQTDAAPRIAVILRPEAADGLRNL